MPRKKLYLIIFSISIIICGGFVILAGVSLNQAKKTNNVSIKGTAIEGIVVGDKTYSWPTETQPILYGYVNVSYNQTSGGGRAPQSTSLLKNNYLGDPKITIQKIDGTKEQVTLIKPLENWYGIDITEKKYSSLDEVPELASLQPEKKILNLLNYSVSSLAVHPGDKLFIDKAQDGTATKVWFGGIEAFNRQAQNHQSGSKIMGWILIIAGLIILLAGFFIFIFNFRKKY